MPLRRGYAVISIDGKAVDEKDTFTCNHCNSLVFLDTTEKRQDPSKAGGFCRACMQHICPKCAYEGMTATKCVPFERRLDAIESKDRFRRALFGG